jgi:3-deoxy-D-manno-octulosonic-acid transferase
VSLLLYHFFLWLYRAGIGVYSLFDAKAAKWVNGRRQWREKISVALPPGKKNIWVHCSSLGEFEQGRPLIEALKAKYPNHRLVISFFSPSGYEVRKDFPHADLVCYLPLDGKKNAKDFIRLINPALAVFVKYEFWYYYLHELHEINTPVIVVSAAFRKGQAFFRWYGRLFRSLLDCFSWIFVQDEASEKLLAGIGLSKNVSVSGDTRYDRVSTIAAKKMVIRIAEEFKSSGKLIIAGSTWPGDEKLLRQCMEHMPGNWKLVIAPHEIDATHIRAIRALFDNDVLLYSAFSANSTQSVSRVLIIDNIGLLSGLYAYGDIAFIGGGFQKSGIHNVLEPAVFGLPVVFGPEYKKFPEAKRLVELGFGFPVTSTETAEVIFQRLISDDAQRDQIKNSLQKFMAENTGATGKILELIEQKGWL